MNRTGNRSMKDFDSKAIHVISVFAAIALVLFSIVPASAAPPKHPGPTLAQPQQPVAADSDKTLSAMQDELDRASTRLEL
jgi:hypothetical protein